MTSFELECLSYANRCFRKLFEPRLTVSLPLHSDFGLKKGVFITLKHKGDLRGCIGCIESDLPLKHQIPNMVAAAAFDDPRFSSVESEEWCDINLSITILDPMLPFHFDDFIIGRHGLFVKNSRTSGLLLPQVAVEQGWDLHSFIMHVFEKAHMSAAEGAESDLYMFAASELHSN